MGRWNNGKKKTTQPSTDYSLEDLSSVATPLDSSGADNSIPLQLQELHTELNKAQRLSLPKAKSDILLIESFLTTKLKANMNQAPNLVGVPAMLYRVIFLSEDKDEQMFLEAISVLNKILEFKLEKDTLAAVLYTLYDVWFVMKHNNVQSVYHTTDILLNNIVSVIIGVMETQPRYISINLDSAALMCATSVLKEIAQSEKASLSVLKYMNDAVYRIANSGLVHTATLETTLKGNGYRPINIAGVDADQGKELSKNLINAITCIARAEPATMESFLAQQSVSKASAPATAASAPTVVATQASASASSTTTVASAPATAASAPTVVATVASAPAPATTAITTASAPAPATTESAPAPATTAITTESASAPATTAITTESASATAASAPTVVATVASAPAPATNNVFASSTTAASSALVPATTAITTESAQTTTDNALESDSTAAASATDTPASAPAQQESSDTHNAGETQNRKPLFLRVNAVLTGFTTSIKQYPLARKTASNFGVDLPRMKPDAAVLMHGFVGATGVAYNLYNGNLRSGYLFALDSVSYYGANNILRATHLNPYKQCVYSAGYDAIFPAYMASATVLGALAVGAFAFTTSFASCVLNHQLSLEENEQLFGSYTLHVRNAVDVAYGGLSFYMGYSTGSFVNYAVGSMKVSNAVLDEVRHFGCELPEAPESVKVQILDPLNEQLHNVDDIPVLNAIFTNNPDYKYDNTPAETIKELVSPHVDYVVSGVNYISSTAFSVDYFDCFCSCVEWMLLTEYSTKKWASSIYFDVKEFVLSKFKSSASTDDSDESTVNPKKMSTDCDLDEMSQYNVTQNETFKPWSVVSYTGTQVAPDFETSTPEFVDLTLTARSEENDTKFENTFDSSASSREILLSDENYLYNDSSKLESVVMNSDILGKAKEDLDQLINDSYLLSQENSIGLISRVLLKVGCDDVVSFVDSVLEGSDFGPYHKDLIIDAYNGFVMGVCDSQ